MKTAISSCSEPARAAPCFQRRQRVKPRLQSTSAQQLTILKDNLTVAQQGSFTTSRSVLPNDLGTFTQIEMANRSAERTVDVSGTMLFLLEKIAFNTFATSFNIAEQNRVLGSGLPWRVGNYAEGGIAPPHSMAIYGEHHPQGPFYMQTGSHPVPITPSMPSFRGGGGDRELIAELKALRDELKEELRALRKENGMISFEATHQMIHQHRTDRDVHRKLSSASVAATDRQAQRARIAARTKS